MQWRATLLGMLGLVLVATVVSAQPTVTITMRLAEAEFREKGADVLGVRTDVSKSEDLEKLAQQTLDAFGAVHIVCNNAGVA